jgi:hypothetical protein
MTDYLGHRKNFSFPSYYIAKLMQPDFDEMFTEEKATIIAQRGRRLPGRGLRSDGKR